MIRTILLLAAEDVEKFAKTKTGFQMLSRGNARSASKSMQNILSRKVHVSAARGAFLQSVVSSLPEDAAPFGDLKGKEEDGLDGPGRHGCIPLLLLNFTDEQVLFSQLPSSC
jgi:hypothetical protein